MPLQPQFNLHDFMALSEAPNEYMLKRRVERFAHGMDFGLYGALLVKENEGARADVVYIGNIPAGYQAAAGLPANVQRSPVIRRYKRLSVPFAYDQAMYVAEGCADLWEQQAPFGYRTGIGLALHLPGRKHLALGFNRETPLPTHPTQLAQLYASLSMAALHVCEAAERLALFPQEPKQAQSEGVRLTAREAEVLKRAMEGKPSSAIADTLRVCERTVNFHVGNAMAKLGCQSRTQAWLKARRLGLI
jgi:DNA-binding CsgD family transcriptional regulator